MEKKEGRKQRERRLIRISLLQDKILILRFEAHISDDSVL